MLYMLRLLHKYINCPASQCPVFYFRAVGGWNFPPPSNSQIPSDNINYTSNTKFDPPNLLPPNTTILKLTMLNGTASVFHNQQYFFNRALTITSHVDSVVSTIFYM